MYGTNTTIALDSALSRVALNQLGLITRAGALELGMSKDSLRRRVEAGLLKRVHPGVYRIAASESTFEQQCLAACLAANHSILGDRSAAVVHGLPLNQPPRPELIIPHGSVFRSPDVVVRQTRYLPSSRPWFSTRITTVSSTLVALAGQVSPETLGRCVDHCLINRLTTVEHIRRELAGSGQQRFRGRDTLEAELDKRTDGRMLFRSRVEQNVGRWIERAKLPQPISNFIVRINGRTYELDFAWPRFRVALEVSPFFTHGSARTQQRDVEKRRALASIDWRFVEASDPDLVNFAAFGPTIEILRAVLVHSGVILAL